MKSVLEDIQTSATQTLIIVKNLADKSSHSYPVKDKALEKIALIAGHIKEENRIELTLTLEDNLAVVSNFEAKINGIQIDFKDSFKPENGKSKPQVSGLEKWLIRFAIKASIIFVIIITVMYVLANAGKWF